MMYCETRTVTVYAHSFSLNKPMVKMFCMFIEDYLNLRRPLVPREMRGTHSMKVNFATLRHLGLIQKVSKGEGWWPTPFGMLFYRGELPVTVPVLHMAEETLPDNHVAYTLLTKPRRKRYIYDIDEERYTQVKEIQAEMRDTPSLFPTHPLSDFPSIRP